MNGLRRISALRIFTVSIEVSGDIDICVYGQTEKDEYLDITQRSEYAPSTFSLSFLVERRILSTEKGLCGIKLGSNQRTSCFLISS